ncbi:hypothetical protein [Okeania sp. SIO2B3]|nr:hypothetical protein [Okeania sp. SIO2B3]NET43162.1 hypothetical protein [Okeania sp. SIO2B3]
MSNNSTNKFKVNPFLKFFSGKYSWERSPFQLSVISYQLSVISSSAQ